MNFNLKELIWMGVVITIILVLVIWLIIWFWGDDAIRSTTPIIPEIELVIIENVVDTVYVYRKP